MSAQGAGDAVPAGFFRRFAALVYDALLVTAVLFLGTLLLLPLTGGEAITPQQSGPWELAYRGWIALLLGIFFGFSWTRRGQTLGMMSWKIRLQRLDGRLPGWRRALGRLVAGGVLAVCALAGLVSLTRGSEAPAGTWGVMLLLPALADYLSMAFDPARRTLLDRLTGCRVVRTG